jgi:hypothetical protein
MGASCQTGCSECSDDAGEKLPPRPWLGVCQHPSWLYALSDPQGGEAGPRKRWLRPTATL